MELLTVDDLSELLRVSRNKIILLTRRGEIPAYVVCGKIRFDANEVEAWLKQNQLKPEALARLEA